TSATSPGRPSRSPTTSTGASTPCSASPGAPSSWSRSCSSPPARVSPMRSLAAPPSYGAGSPARSRSISSAAAPPGSATVANGAGSRASPPPSPPEALPRYHLSMGRLAVGLIGAGKHGHRYTHHIRAGVPVLRAHTLRWNAVVRAIRERLPSLGPLRALYLNQRFEVSSLPWLDDPRTAGGGIILHTGVHSFDLVRWVTGHEVARVWCR